MSENGGFLAEHGAKFQALVQLDEELDKLDAETTTRKQARLKLEEELVQLMDDSGVPRLSIGDRTFFRRVDRYPRVPDQEVLFKWLQDEGRNDLIKPTVNVKSLGAFLRERREEQNLEDPSCVEMFQVNRVGIRRSKA